MATTNKTLLQQALEAIFGKPANALPPTTNFAKPTVRLATTSIAPSQFEALVALCQYFGEFPTLVRSGEYVTVIFTC
jgi:hypothetical protein